jgi:hypothetical protein
MKTKRSNVRATNSKKVSTAKHMKKIMNINLKNPLGPNKRQVDEEVMRANEMRAHRERLITKTIKNGLYVNCENNGHCLFPQLKLNYLQKIAANIYITRLLRVYGDGLDVKAEKFVKHIKQDFENMDSYTKYKYIAAALLEDPLHADKVSSNAYLVFVDLHCEKQMYPGTKAGQARKHRGSFRTPTIGYIKTEVAGMWKKMKPNQKLPFFLKAYLGTFAPRQLDGAILKTFDKPKPKINSRVEYVIDTEDIFDDVSFIQDEDEFIL